MRKTEREDILKSCENLTDRQTIWHRRIFCLLILAFFIVLCFCSPYALDDWFYGSSSGISCMNQGWSTLNGRYLSNMLMLVFSVCFGFAPCLWAWFSLEFAI